MLGAHRSQHGHQSAHARAVLRQQPLNVLPEQFILPREILDLLERQRADFHVFQRGGVALVPRAGDAVDANHIPGHVVARDLALAVLREQQFDEGLPAYLPEGLRCASKTGSLPGVRHDIAVIESGDAWVAVAALATDLLDGPFDRGTSI